MHIADYVFNRLEEEVKFQKAPWYFGVIASFCGATLTHPLDLMAVNVQANALKFVSAKRVMKVIVKKHGLPGLYFAFPGAVLKCLVQSSSSFLILRSFDQRLLAPTCYDLLLLAMVSGISAGAISTPFVKVSIVMQADLTRENHAHRNFKNTWSAVQRLYCRGGLAYLYQGAGLQAIHGTFVTLGEIIAFGKMKEFLETYQQNQAKWKRYFLSMTLSSSLIHLLLTPVKLIRCVVMNADCGKYKSSLDAWKHIKKVHGYRGLSIGYQTTLLRIIPHSFLVAYTYELLIRNFLFLNT